MYQVCRTLVSPTCDIQLNSIWTGGANGTVTLPRIEMVNVLREGLAASASTQPADFFTPHLSKRLVSYEEDSSGVTLQFQDGSSARADVLIGADGIGSPTRRTMYDNLAEGVKTADPQKAEFYLNHKLPIWAGIYVFRFLVDSAKIKAVDPNHLTLNAAIAVCICDIFSSSAFSSLTVLIVR